MIRPYRNEYATSVHDDALVDFRQDFQEAIAARDAAESAYNECPCDIHWYRLRAEEERLSAAIREARMAGVAEDMEGDDDWLRLIDGVGRAVVWLLALLAPVAVAGWWWAWR